MLLVECCDGFSDLFNSIVQRIRKLERRSVNPDALVEGKGNVPTRIFFEGLEDTDFRTFALTKGMLRFERKLCSMFLYSRLRILCIVMPFV